MRIADCKMLKWATELFLCLSALRYLIKFFVKPCKVLLKYLDIGRLFHYVSIRTCPILLKRERTLFKTYTVAVVRRKTIE